jgi:hypothetical protein
VTRPVVNPGTVLWSGEHWIDYLREPGGEGHTAMFSLYDTIWSTAGEGVTAYVDIPGFTGVYTDNRAVAVYVHDLLIRLREDHPFNRSLTVFDAELVRGGDIRAAPSWTVRTPETTIVATWEGLGDAVVTEGPVGTFTDRHDYFTVLFFASRATITVNGSAVPGEPYTTTQWDRSIGGERSSCVFALAETMTLVPEA